jgi:hypothetical protein
MQRVIQSVLAAAILLGTAATTRAESVMKQCGEQWQAAKSAGTTNGATWPQLRLRLLCLLLAPSLQQAPYSRGKRRPLLPQLRRPRRPLATKA